MLPPLPLRSLAAIALVCLLTSCASHHATYRISKPATDELPFAGERILLIDRHWTHYQDEADRTLVGSFIVKNTPLIKQLHKRHSRSQEQSIRTALASLLSVSLAIDFVTIFEEFGKYEVMLMTSPPAISKPENTAFGELPPPLAASEVGALAAQHSADILLALESVEVVVGEHEEKRIVEEKSKNDEVKKKTYYDGWLRLTCTVVFRVYDPLSGLWVDFKTTSSQSKEEWSDYGSSISSRRIAAMRDALLERSLETAINDFARSLTPHTISVSRKILVDSSSRHKEQLEEAAERFASSAYWKDAVEIWQSLLPLEQPGFLKAKILYNLSLAAEREQDLDQALILAEKAVAESDQGIIRRNRDRLARRVDEQLLFESQIPPGQEF
ncbi:DUF6340 family protein [Pelagicoccus sp. SDUM812003]|uniref:DUF6340 family protein n=1 Tax=Pelagicoccus sp. SDUM812003 TaxID=3041267 RepID=UPI00280DA849|nr:DUF6340 family protein [Pelagicoccus sp. SDUM812003]MDQ8202279.1 DUF6340 family protein [Pelagicoccus sp. SDUM812003]